jgi:hypothetical protein
MRESGTSRIVPVSPWIRVMGSPREGPTHWTAVHSPSGDRSGPHHRAFGGRGVRKRALPSARERRMTALLSNSAACRPRGSIPTARGEAWSGVNHSS